MNYWSLVKEKVLGKNSVKVILALATVAAVIAGARMASAIEREAAVFGDPTNTSQSVARERRVAGEMSDDEISAATSLSQEIARDRRLDEDAPAPVVKVDGDEDGDGVKDSKDKCPGTPRGATVDANGCPTDSDGDKVFDGIDKCPDTPVGTPVDASGCPLDSDSDGVLDNADKCPGTPRGVKVDETGCPIAKKITEKITLHINYASDSSDPDADSKTKLDEVAERIIAYPETKVEIRGFTDDISSEDYNLTLSQKRAEGVMNYLVSKGVPSSQMTPKGYGENPQYFVAPNDTKEGRRQNRRVEIESIN